MFTFIDVEVPAAGEVWNVAFDRRVADDGTEMGIQNVLVHTHSYGPQPLKIFGRRRAEILRAVETWCRQNPMLREDLQPDYDGRDF
jgi:hypothetical protein